MIIDNDLCGYTKHITTNSVIIKVNIVTTKTFNLQKDRAIAVATVAVLEDMGYTNKDRGLGDIIEFLTAEHGCCYLEICTKTGSFISRSIPLDNNQDTPNLKDIVAFASRENETMEVFGKTYRVKEVEEALKGKEIEKEQTFGILIGGGVNYVF